MTIAGYLIINKKTGRPAAIFDNNAEAEYWLKLMPCELSENYVVREAWVIDKGDN